MEKKFKTIAILLHKTDAELWEICEYLDLKQKKEKKNSKEEMLSKETIQKLDKALNEMKVEKESYSLAEEFALISSELSYMDVTLFAAYDNKTYKEAEDYFNNLAIQILQECQNKNADEYADIMKDGKIKHEKENEAISRYMISNGFHRN